MVFGVTQTGRETTTYRMSWGVDTLTTKPSRRGMFWINNWEVKISRRERQWNIVVVFWPLLANDTQVKKHGDNRSPNVNKNQHPIVVTLPRGNVREVKISPGQRERYRERQWKLVVVFVTSLYTKWLRFQNDNENVKATRRNAMNKIITQNNASQICNNIPFRPLCSFNLFLKCWQSYFQSFSVWTNLDYDERLIASISSSATTTTNWNLGRPQEMITSAQK